MRELRCKKKKIEGWIIKFLDTVDERLPFFICESRSKAHITPDRGEKERGG